MIWNPSSWRSCEITQAPDYADSSNLKSVESRIKTYPPLIYEGEIFRLRQQLALAEKGEAFVLQGGDCAESFSEFRPETIRDTFRILLQMAIVLTFGSKRSLIKIGRIAGQYAKPRTLAYETRGQETLPAYRGDLINGFEFNPKDRQPDPQRMEKAYFYSAATLNLLRAYAKGGFADLNRIHSWNLEFARRSNADPRYEKILERIQETLTFMKATGQSSEKLESIEFFTSHESLLLNYEEALVRYDENKKPFAGSAHMIWIGERTNQIDGAHVEFARGVSNPVGLKCGPDLKSDDLLRLIHRLNPYNESGRLMLIPRLGARRVGEVLPQMIRRIKENGCRVIWCCDPMHGNTSTTSSGIKTRSFDNILSETRDFLDIHQAEGTIPGGVHFELTGRNVYECTGGAQNILEEHLGGISYETLCDPRLNAHQSLEFAFQLVR